MSRPQAADELSQQDLRVLLDNAPDAIGRFDRELRHVYVNEATALANARPAEDFIGRSMEDLGHAPEVCAQINTNLQAVFASGKERTFNLLFPGPQGPVWYQCRMAPEFDENDAVQFVLVISRDITEHRKNERLAREVARDAATAKVISLLAHELNNPLYAAINSVYLLQNHPLDENGRQLLHWVSENLDRISQISREILSLQDKQELADLPRKDHRLDL